MNPPEAVATASQTVGPFFSFGLTTNVTLGQVVPEDTPGEHIQLDIRVLDGAGTPVPDAVVELWHVDHQGEWRFGRLGTGLDGTSAFRTVRPPALPGEAAHVNLCLFMRGLLRHLYTRLYFAGDDALEHDAVLAAVPFERRQTLLARRDDAATTRWLFDIHLQGERETVYFDL